MNDDEDTTDCIQVTLTRSPLYGFGIAINGGNDNGDNQSLIISDVIKNGPADGKLLSNDRIVNVNGHPVVRYMEYTALKLIRESTDFVNLIVERQKQPMIIMSDNELPIKCILNKTCKGEKFGITLDCRYFIKKIHLKNNEILTNIQEDDEIIKINEMPVNRWTLQEAQKLIDKTKERLILHIVPNKYHNYQASTSSYKQTQSDYNQHVLKKSTNNHRNMIRPHNSTRYLSFFTDTSSIGIRLAGGNKYGLFICEIQPNSVAYKAGLFVADKIFSVNNIDFSNITREDAVLCLMNMKTSQMNMIVSNLPDEYEQLLGDVGGDSLYIRTHFAYNSSHVEELSIGINDILHVTDTLYNGQIGHWVATKLNRFSSENKPSGAIPNQSRAEQLVETAPKLDELIKLRQSSFKRKLRTKFIDKRSRSVLSLNHFKEDSILTKVTCWKPITKPKFSAYERVRLKSITIIRPVVLLGSLADIARDRLLDQYPDKFESPETFMASSTKSHANIIKLQSIKNVIQKNRHCLLDISPSAIEQLNNAECYPIVIYFKASNRNVIKEIRNDYGKLYQQSSRRLLENAEHLEYFYSYLFTSIINVDTSRNWYETLKLHIESQQEQPIWMSTDRFIEKDLLKSDEYFISTRLSDSDDFSFQDQSSLDSDIIKKKEKSSLQRVLSDPIVFRKDKFPKTYLTDLPHHTSDNEAEEDSTCLQTSAISLPNHKQTLFDMPTTDNEQVQYQSDILFSNSLLNNQRSLQNSKVNNNDHFISIDKFKKNRTLPLNQYEKNCIENESKFISTNSLATYGLSTNQNSSLGRSLISQKIPAINYNEQMNLNNNLRFNRKDSSDKSTMTDKNSTIDSYATWNRNCASVENEIHKKHNPSVNFNEKFSSESLSKQIICSSKTQNSQLHSALCSSDHSKSPLQKPRVYTHHDPISLIQQQTIVSSSSESSASSLKDKTIKEVGETRSYSIQDGSNVIGSARGIMDYYGGKLSCPLTGVSLFIPMGAISEDIQQEIYFQVHQDASHTEKFHGRLLSPIVICGPHGIKFNKPVELIIPHSAGNDAEQLSLLLHGNNQDRKINDRQHNKSLVINGINRVTNSNVSILVDHF
ncbi:unnamed protein product [Rotaria socialis]|uniref:Tight junction protein ZO-3 n=1 Tax=Rotaria socialis TaxID=392032 RepID=A0A818CN85_9BILA|nr:unnamed protein product [Rotaria socialis]CAF3434710.1 unnamed protein product [Rotaria socialis]CAF4285033.1 unnamed protein product [Rotaria socialis]CAF4351460.1 unnamed protein product [Rotaria socialis]